LPYVIVFDNYHHLPSTSGFHDMLREALSAVLTVYRSLLQPRDAAIIACRARGLPKLYSIGWDDLKFGRDEIAGLFNRRNRQCPATSCWIVSRQ